MLYKELNLPPIPTDLIDRIEGDTSRILKNRVNQDYGFDHFLMGSKIALLL